MDTTTSRPASGRSAFVLALRQLPGVGRVIVSRVLNAFGSYEHLLEYPREQVLVRLKGLPRASEITAALFDRKAMEHRIAEAHAKLDRLTRKQVSVIAEGEPDYPAAFGGLPDAYRPNLLYTFGKTRPPSTGDGLAVIAHPPLSETAFELAQAAVGKLPQWNRRLIAGLSTGFDVAVLKRMTDRSDVPRPVALADCGLARLRNHLRPAARDLVQAGGLIMSGFDMDHGPFPHDIRERAMQQVALGRAGLFVGCQPDGFEWTALTWAAAHHRSVFAITDNPDSLPEGVHPLRTTEDLDWIAVALRAGGQQNNSNA